MKRKKGVFTTLRVRDDLYPRLGKFMDRMGYEEKSKAINFSIEYTLNEFNVGKIKSKRTYSYKNKY
jgi:hypothetical protein